MDNQTVPVSMWWDLNSGIHGAHFVEVLAHKDGYVYFYNPHGEPPQGGHTYLALHLERDVADQSVG